MSQQIDIKAKVRTQTGKGPAHRLHAEGKFPAIVYGGDKEPQAITLDAHDFDNHIKHGLRGSSLIQLDIDGADNETAILREVQREPVSRRVRHVDFIRVARGNRVEFQIPVKAKGTNEAIRSGGILERLLREVKIKCDPFEVPQFVEVSIDTLGFNKPIVVADLPLGEGIEVKSDPRAVVFAVTVPRAQVSAMGKAGAAGEEADEAAEEGTDGAAEGESTES